VVKEARDIQRKVFMDSRKGIRYKKPPLIEASVSGSTDLEPVIVQPPKKRILASRRVELSPDNFKRRLPTPVISPEPEVEP